MGNTGESAAQPIRILSLFSGCDGLGLGVSAALDFLGIAHRFVGYVEREGYAAATLLERMEDKSLGPAPVWTGDIRELDGRELRDGVDFIIGGFPCQDISTAGRGAGIEHGNRSGLWYEFARLIREIRPAGLYLENVSAITIRQRGLDRVLGELAAMGFSAEWGCLSAEAVGASQSRERWFCLALADADSAERRRQDAWRQAEQRASIGRAGAAFYLGVSPVGESSMDFPPGPRDFDKWDLLFRSQAARIGTWAPAIERGVHLSLDGASVVLGESRTDQLRACGNGAIPQQSAAMFVELFQRSRDSQRRLTGDGKSDTIYPC